MPHHIFLLPEQLSTSFGRKVVRGVIALDQLGVASTHQLFFASMVVAVAILGSSSSRRRRCRSGNILHGNDGQMQRNALALTLLVDLIKPISSLDAECTGWVIDRQRRIPLEEAQGERLVQPKTDSLTLSVEAVQVQKEDNPWPAGPASLLAYFLVA